VIKHTNAIYFTKNERKDVFGILSVKHERLFSQAFQGLLKLCELPS